jgi:membrane-associated phospholipid phosphatase
MMKLLKENRWFLIPHSIFILISLVFIFTFPKGTIHIYLNSFHSPFFDNFFKYVTNLGDGWSIPLFVILMLFIRYRQTMLLVLVYALSGLLTQLLKRAFFADVARPTRYLEGTADLHLVPGVDQLCCHSFPSGHSTTAFGVMICFALILKNKYLKLLSFFVALIIAYSRVYLSQHFLVDILAGSVIGVITGLVLYQLMMNLQWNWLDRNLTNDISGKK